MEDYQKIKNFYEKSLLLVNIIENHCHLIDKKISVLKKEKSNQNIFKVFDDIIVSLRQKNEYLKERLSCLACDITKENDSLTEILDAIYLNQDKINSLVDIFNENFESNNN